MRHHRKSRRGLTTDDSELVGAVVPGWQRMTDTERERTKESTDWLLRSKSWEAAQGFDLSEPIRIHIAAQASLLILGLDHDTYRQVHAIIVHPTRMVRSRVRAGPARGVVSSGPVTILGEASSGSGPVVIAWDAVVDETQHPQRGRNVVFHEFAHKIDMLDDVVDGTPPLTNPTQRQRWIDVCTAAIERVRQGHTNGALRDYAATNPGEFFAVATEAFFTAPEKLDTAEPELYDVLRAFYRQDPAARADRK